jgi:hypothetical protein
MTPEERKAALLPLGRVLLASLERHAAAKAAKAQPPPPPPVTDVSEDELRKRPRYRPFKGDAGASRSKTEDGRR